MSNRPPISWSAALRDLTNDRSKPHPVREERLRSAAGLRGTSALALSAWRGQSGCRYVVGVHRIASAQLDAEDFGDAVLLAVRRGDIGIACLIEVATTDAIDVPAWIAAAAEAGATEITCHRLADDADARAAIVADLLPGLVDGAERALIADAMARGRALAADMCGAR